MSEQFGFVGVGRMGGPMASRLLDAGHTLVVHDVNPAGTAALAARGARVAASPAEVASAAETVFISLPTPDIVARVVTGADGLLHGNRMRTVIDLSTTGPRVAAATAETVAQAGRAVFVDAPVSGGVSGAAAGTLAVMVSCPRANFDALEPVLRTFGRVFFCGEKPGLAQSLKLANNLLSATALAVTAEAMAMGVKAGLDPQVMLDVINVGSGRNTSTTDKFPRSVLTGKFDFGFATALLHKDVRLCVDEAEAIGVPMIVGSAVRQMLAVTEALHGPESDFTCLAKVLESWAGVTIRSGS